MFNFHVHFLVYVLKNLLQKLQATDERYDRFDYTCMFNSRLHTIEDLFDELTVDDIADLKQIILLMVRFNEINGADLRESREANPDPENTAETDEQYMAAFWKRKQDQLKRFFNKIDELSH